MKETLTELKEESNRSTIILVNLNIPLSLMARTTTSNISKEIGDLNKQTTDNLLEDFTNFQTSFGGYLSLKLNI